MIILKWLSYKTVDNNLIYFLQVKKNRQIECCCAINPFQPLANKKHLWQDMPILATIILAEWANLSKFLSVEIRCFYLFLSPTNFKPMNAITTFSLTHVFIVTEIIIHINVIIRYRNSITTYFKSCQVKFGNDPHFTIAVHGVPPFVVFLRYNFKNVSFLEG